MIEFRPSPNHNDRPAGVLQPELIVVHGTAGSTSGDRDWIMRRQAGVSYHIHVGTDGSRVRFVTDDKRAWHAGESKWKGRSNVNDFSLGVGLAGLPNGEHFTDAQYESTAWVIRRWMKWYNLTLDKVVGHDTVSYPRKTDPWARFEWMRLARQIVEG